MPHYNEDGLLTKHNHEFINDPKFIKAFDRGMQAHGSALNVRWKIHIALWIAEVCKRLDGDFVECGVNRGILSSSIMQYIDWNSMNKHFFLFDTFNGLDLEFLSDQEKQSDIFKYNNELYPECFEQVKENFKEFDRVHLIRGSVPITLTEMKIDKVCYLSLDMNCTIPQIAAAEFFWSRMVSGAIALLDDYTYEGYEEQKKGFDKFAMRKNIPILYLPTGQGLYIKP